MRNFLEWYAGFVGEEMAGLFAVIWIATMAVSAVFLIVNYFFSSSALYAIAKRRGLRAYGLAWVPFGWTWLFGCVADQFDRETKGRDRHFRIVLLIGDIVASAALVVGMVILLTTFADFMSVTMYGELTDIDVLIKMLSSMLLYYVLLIPALVFGVFYYIAMYRVYRSCSPKASGWLLALAIILNLHGLEASIPLFCLRKKDEGFALSEIVSEEAECKRLELYN